MATPLPLFDEYQGRLVEQLSGRVPKEFLGSGQVRVRAIDTELPIENDLLNCPFTRQMSWASGQGVARTSYRKC